MPTVSFNTNFPGYDVLGEIGRSNARVLKARHIASGDLVAIKHFALNTDADTLRRFERESAIMTRMVHPNIVRVREVRLNTDLPYIVLDYIEGGSVRQLINQNGGLSVELTTRLGLQVINAFRLIHAEGIIHRDVKPENILYHQLASGELHFLLTDFGVARLHEQPVTVTGQSLMTYEYAAPEQFDNPRNVSEAVDYYALGVVLYECLTGKVPFAMRDETGIVTFMNAVLATPPPTPVLASGLPIPGSLVNLVKQLLAKSPAERLHKPDEVRLALKQAEVEQLHFEQRQSAPAPDPASASRTQTYRPAAPATPHPGDPHPGAPQPAYPSGATQVATPPRSSLVTAAIVASALLLASVGAYWFFTRTDTASPSLTAQSETTPPAPTSVADSTTEAIGDEQTLDENQTRPVVDTPAGTARPTPRMTDTLTSIRPLERAVQQKVTEATQQRLQQQAAAAMSQLSAETFGGKTGLFGGVKGLSVQLTNNSMLTFKSVAVQVQYITAGGEVHTSKTMYFNHVTPNATIVRKAPDNPRGTRFRARVLRADVENPDENLTDSPLIP